MRIISGTYKGKKIISADNKKVRPTSNKVKEAFFNIIMNDPDFFGCRFADICAGSGNIGLEAFSRGASFCLFIDMNPSNCRLIRKNCDTLKIKKSDFQIKCIDYTRFKQDKYDNYFDYIYLDPPYEKRDLYHSSLYLLNFIKKTGNMIIEAPVNMEIDELKGYDTRVYGDTKLIIINKSAVNF